MATRKNHAKDTTQPTKTKATKDDLVKAYADTADVSGKAALTTVNMVLQCIEQLVSTLNLQLIGFGTFKHVTRKARTGRNPKTGESIMIPETKTIKFKPAKEFIVRSDPETPAQPANTPEPPATEVRSIDSVSVADHTIMADGQQYGIAEDVSIVDSKGNAMSFADTAAVLQHLSLVAKIEILGKTVFTIPIINALRIVQYRGA